MTWDRPKIGVPVILLLGAALGIAYNAFHVKPVPWIAQPRQTATLSGLGLAEENPGAASIPDPKPLSPHPEMSAPSVAAPVPEEGTAPSTPLATESPDPASPATATSGDPGPSPASSLAARIPEQEFPILISLDEAKAIFDSGAARVLDARSRDEYAEGHLPGAVPAPYEELGADDAWLAETAASSPILLVYCGGGDCELSLDLAFALNQAGHRRVLVFEDGLEGWTAAGHPVATGGAP